MKILISFTSKIFESKLTYKQENENIVYNKDDKNGQSDYQWEIFIPFCLCLHEQSTHSYPSV